jgi:hypothetical protein
MGNEHEFEVPVGFTVGDLYRLATNLSHKYGTEVELTIGTNKITAEVKDERV